MVAYRQTSRKHLCLLISSQVTRPDKLKYRLCDSFFWRVDLQLFAKLEAPPAGEEWSSTHKTSSSYYLLLILMAQMVKNLPGMWKTGLDPWIGRMRAWQRTPVFLPGESPWTEETGGLQSMGSQRVRYDWATKHTHVHNSISNCGGKSKDDRGKLLYKLF